MSIRADGKLGDIPRHLQGAVVLVDASVYIFRAWYSMPDQFFTEEGRPVNALYGFTLFLLDLVDRARPQYVAVAFDEALGSCFRNSIYPSYKSSRLMADEDLAYQMEQCRKACRALGFRVFSGKRYEADDYLGSAGALFSRHKKPVLYVTRDKDIAQLLRPGDYIWDFAAGAVNTKDEIERKMLVSTHNIPDLLGIAGDKVDDIPGVPGIGLKIAGQLLQEYGSLEDILLNLGKIEASGLRGGKRIAALLADNEELAVMSKKLATIKTDINLKCSAADLRWSMKSHMDQRGRKRFIRFLKSVDLHRRMHRKVDRIYGLE